MQGEGNCDKEISQALLRTWTNVHFCAHTFEKDLKEYGFS